MKKIVSFVIVLLVIGITEIKAQSDYTFSAGLGIDVSSYNALVGPSAKYFFSENSAVQADVNFASGTTGITGLYEYHQAIEAVEGLKWYAGAGASLWFHDNVINSVNDGNSTLFALRPVGGAEYKLNSIPLAFTFDWRPFIKLSDTYLGNQIGTFGLGARYIIK